MPSGTLCLLPEGLASAPSLAQSLRGQSPCPQRALQASLLSIQALPGSFASSLTLRKQLLFLGSIVRETLGFRPGIQGAGKPQSRGPDQLYD